MSNLILHLGILLAQAEGGGEAAKEKAPSFLESLVASPLTLFAVLGLLFYIMILKPQQRQRREQQMMLQNMKVNDRVVTIGGIQGTIVSLTEQDVSIRIDESTNTKIRLGRPYVQRVVTEDAKSDGKPS